METAIIISFIIIALLLTKILDNQKEIKKDVSLFVFTQNLAQEKTRQCDNLTKHIKQLIGLIAEQKNCIDYANKKIKQLEASEIGELAEALRQAEAKNEYEYKRGWDARGEELCGEGIVINGGIWVNEELEQKEITAEGTNEC